MIQRSAIQEWVKWQVICAAVFSVDGGVYTLKYPYETYTFLNLPQLPYLGPVARFGRLPSADFPLAAPVPAQGPTLPLAGIIMMVLGPLFGLLEADVIGGIMAVPDFIKGIVYIAMGVVSSTQLTGVQPGFQFVFAGLCLLYSSFTPAPKAKKALPR